VYEKSVGGGAPIKLSDSSLGNAYVVDWANNGSAALVTYSEQGDSPNFAHIAFTASSSIVTKLDDTTLFAAVSPDGMRIAFATKTDEGSTIATALPNATKPQKLTTHPQSQLLMSWGVTARPMVRNPGSSFVQSLAWMLTGSTYTPLTPAGYQLSVLEEFTGRYVLYSAAESSAGTPTLYLVDTKAPSSKDRVTIAPFTTYPEKCAWARTSLTTIYCAIPMTMPKQIYDAWLRGEHHFEDRIASWNFQTGEVHTISEGNFDGIELSVAPDDSALLFVNKNDSSLWSLGL
jgi:Tol biopolymer transport system component